MFLAADSDEHRTDQQASTLELAMLRCRYRPPSVLLHHGKACCAIAREWTFATDYSQLNGQHELTGPRWIRARYKWGPSKWPLSWCEAVEKKTLDCGALSAMTRALFEARGIAAYPVQLIQLYSEQSARHWTANWNAEEAAADWVMNGLVYHEACAVVIDGNSLKIWDPSAACWVSPPTYVGYGSVLALRVLGRPMQSLQTFNWGGHQIEGNQWHKIELTSNDVEDAASTKGIINQAIALEQQMAQVDSYRYESSVGGD